MTPANRIVTYEYICRADKGDGQTYIWLYDDDTVSSCIRSIGRQAANPELSLNWYDAALLVEAIRGRKK